MAIVFGIMGLLSGLVHEHSGLIAGPVMILGSLAYRSRKRRLLGWKSETFVRRGLEVLYLVVIALLVGAQNNLVVLIATDPVPNLVIPAWAFVEYHCAGFRTTRNNIYEVPPKRRKPLLSGDKLPERWDRCRSDHRLSS